MKILKNVPLALFSTMRLGGKARYLTHVTSEADLVEALAWAKKQKVPAIMIGAGANIIFTDKGFAGLVMVNDIRGLSLKGTTLTVGAGEVWDKVVAKSVQANLNGIASLSKIPGKAGAAPVQNIGAYGEEISSVLTSVRAFDTRKSEFVTLKRADCDFAYRSSRFNRQDKGRFLITELTLELNRHKPKPPFYRDVQTYLDKNKISDPSPAAIRKAVTQIRKFKLPDPSVVANNGSFFYNPIITRAKFDSLASKYPALNQTPDGWTGPPRWLLDKGRVKLSAGWLIEQAGFNGHEDTKAGIGLWPHQSLVVINKHAKKTQDLLDFTKRITDCVQHQFGIKLKQEPEIVGD